MFPHVTDVTKRHPDMNVGGRNRKRCLAHAPSIELFPPVRGKAVQRSVYRSRTYEADQRQFLRYPEARDSLRPLVALHYMMAGTRMSLQSTLHGKIRAGAQTRE